MVDADPEVITYCEQPLEISYVLNGRLRTSIFDMWIFKKDEVEIFDEEIAVGGQEHSPKESRYFSGFFVLSVQVLVPSQGQELVPIAGMDKNMFLLPIRWISKH